jgi:4-hydroxybutyryl-CoA dehydratase/vinylacetyl-CoA-Delta-isomerase
MLRLIENMSVGAGLPEAMHGAGSPAAQKIIIARRSNIEKKRELAETIAGIRRDENFEKVIGKTEEEHWRETQKKISEQRVKICAGVVGQSKTK